MLGIAPIFRPIWNRPVTESKRVYFLELRRPGADEVFLASFLSCCDRVAEVRLTRTVKASQLSRQFSSQLRLMLILLDPVLFDVTLLRTECKKVCCGLLNGGCGKVVELLHAVSPYRSRELRQIGEGC